LLSVDAKAPFHHHSDCTVPFIELALFGCEVDVRVGRDNVIDAAVAPISRVAVDVVPRPIRACGELVQEQMSVACRPKMNVVVDAADWPPTVDGNAVGSDDGLVLVPVAFVVAVVKSFLVFPWPAAISVMAREGSR
jgi:hypothetical protein